MPCQRFYVLSDSGVPRTFVDDCICVTRRKYDMFSDKIRKRPLVLFSSGTALPLVGQINVLGFLILPVL